MQPAVAVGRDAVLAGGQSGPVVGVGDEVVAERGRGAEHRDQPPAHAGVGRHRGE
jgi:hypothetical protein